MRRLGPPGAQGCTRRLLAALSLCKANCTHTGWVYGRWEKRVSIQRAKDETGVDPLKGARRCDAGMQIDI